MSQKIPWQLPALGLWLGVEQVLENRGYRECSLIVNFAAGFGIAQIEHSTERRDEVNSSTDPVAADTYLDTVNWFVR